MRYVVVAALLFLLVIPADAQTLPVLGWELSPFVGVGFNATPPNLGDRPVFQADSDPGLEMVVFLLGGTGQGDVGIVDLDTGTLQDVFEFSTPVSTTPSFQNAVWIDDVDNDGLLEIIAAVGNGTEWWMMIHLTEPPAEVAAVEVDVTIPPVIVDIPPFPDFPPFPAYDPFPEIIIPPVECVCDVTIPEIVLPEIPPIEVDVTIPPVDVVIPPVDVTIPPVDVLVEIPEVICTCED